MIRTNRYHEPACLFTVDGPLLDLRRFRMTASPALLLEQRGERALYGCRVEQLAEAIRRAHALDLVVGRVDRWSRDRRAS